MVRVRSVEVAVTVMSIQRTILAVLTEYALLRSYTVFLPECVLLLTDRLGNRVKPYGISGE